MLAQLVLSFYIDYKENLITERKAYFVKQPNDPQYAEDIFSNVEYDDLLLFFEQELAASANNGGEAQTIA